MTGNTGVMAFAAASLKPSQNLIGAQLLKSARMTGNTGVMAFAAAGLRTPLGEDFHSVARDAEVAEVEAAAMVQTANCAPEVFAALVASTWCSLLISLWLEEAVRLGVRLEVAYFTLIAGGISSRRRRAPCIGALCRSHGICRGDPAARPAAKRGHAPRRAKRAVLI